MLMACLTVAWSEDLSKTMTLQAAQVCRGWSIFLIFQTAT